MKFEEMKSQKSPKTNPPSQLSTADLKMFKNMNLARVIPYLRENTILWSSKPFFQNLSPQTIQQIITLIFKERDRKSKAQEQLIFHIISMLKQNSAFVQFLAETQNLPKFKMFDFLCQKSPSDQVLPVFGELFVQYARKIPGKLLKIVKEPKVKQIFLSNLHISQVHKVLFTMVFCLGSKPSLNEKKEVEFLISSMLTRLTRNKIKDEDSLNEKQRCLRIEQQIDYAESMANMMNEIILNLKDIFINNILLLLEVMEKTNFIKQCFICMQTPAHPQHSQFILKIIQEILKFDLSLREYPIKEDQNLIEKEKAEIASLRQFSKRQIDTIIAFLPQFIGVILHKDYQKYLVAHNYSSGANVKPIGLVRFRLLEIYAQVFQICISNEEFACPHSHVLDLVKSCLSDNKWNNITQNLIVRVVKLYLHFCYDQFREQNLVKDVSEGFLGFLIESFRNKNFVYLKSMRFSSQGHRHSIYLISKEIIHEMKIYKDLADVKKKFTHWEQFIHQDLKDYEKKCAASKHFNQNMEIELKKTKSEEPSSINEPFQTLQEILQQIEEQKRWSNSPRERRRKNRKQLSVFEAVQHFDSLHVIPSQSTQSP